MANINLSYGIDFGTTNSTIVLVDENNRQIKIPIDPKAKDPSVMRSVIYVDPNKNFYFGQEAIEKYLESVKVNGETEYKTIQTGKYIKVLNSTGESELVPEIVDVEVIPSGRLLQSLKSALSNKTIKKINLFGDLYAIEDLVGMFLREMKKRADKEIGVNIDTAVIGRPIEYVGNDNDLAINRMRSAANYAGFKRVTFEYEPIGAAYDYGADINSDQNTLIFDFGGGTLDISVVKFPEKKILSNAGLKIGGDHFNSLIFSNKLAGYFGKDIFYGMSHIELPSYIFTSLESWYGMVLLKTKDFLNSFESFRFMCSDIKSLNALKSLIFNNFGFEMYSEIETSKKNLTKLQQTSYQFIRTKIQIETIINRPEFETMMKEDIDNIQEGLKDVLLAADISAKDLDYIVTTGGSSLIPVIQNLLIETFGKDKIRSSDTFTSVASGLAQIARQRVSKN